MNPAVYHIDGKVRERESAMPSTDCVRLLAGPDARRSIGLQAADLILV